MIVYIVLFFFVFRWNFYHGFFVQYALFALW